MSSEQSASVEAPKLWTSWRDRRDGTVVTVTRVHLWDCRIALLPSGGQGSVIVWTDRPASYPRHERVDQWDWHHFDLIYDPYTGEERCL